MVLYWFYCSTVCGVKVVVLCALRKLCMQVYKEGALAHGRLEKGQSRSRLCGSALRSYVQRSFLKPQSSLLPWFARSLVPPYPPSSRPLALGKVKVLAVLRAANSNLYH
mmetsp:Transcript_42083/g.108316  ORF Transcript_42083/g.108316 Transcript_42083/m.108316 type:complete len:109 (+) Transcript_42083:768-1094(+)